MSLVNELVVQNFRCFELQRWQFSPSGALISGANAQGKTSILEALCVLLRLATPRSNRPGTLLKHGARDFGLRGELATHQLKLHWQRSTRSYDYQVDDCPMDSAGAYLQSSALLVWLGNDDIELLRSGESRRRFMDFLGCQLHGGYREALFRYKRVLKARNLLLKSTKPNLEWLQAYTQQLVTLGSLLQQARADMLSQLAEHAVNNYRSISSSTQLLECTYQPSNHQELAQAFANSLQRDLRYGQTHAGAHRDDFSLSLDGHKAQDFASEGQQRSIVLALKLAQGHILSSANRQSPIYLIDDVFGELDYRRRNAFMELLPAECQCFITTTHFDWLGQHAKLDDFSKIRLQ